MIANEKEFRTITLRGLDEKPEIVAIMNKVMKAHGLKTGQSVIEHIIMDYDKLQKELNSVKQQRNQEKDQYYTWSNQREQEIEEYKKTISSFKVAFNRIMSSEF